ncbi:MAG: SGNH/GDSL hydrolase family protein [Lachnospiraceae bacterium]
MNQTDFFGLENCMQKAQDGGELTIGFLGGSITQGSLATEHENTYAYRVFTWWKRTFPQAQFHYVNGGIGGTDSLYGVSRAVTDVLMYQPDFIVVDFSVNDKSTAFYQETYEGVIRKLLLWPSHPAVILLNNVYYDTGENAQEYHNAVGDRYHLPHVSIKDTVYQKMKNGKYTREELTPDGLHPNDKGHGLVAEEIIRLLEQVKNRMNTEQMPEKQIDENQMEILPEPVTVLPEPMAVLPEPMTDNAYENAKRLTIREICPKLDGFRTDSAEKKGHLNHFKNGWIGKQAGTVSHFRWKPPVLPYSSEERLTDRRQKHVLYWTVMKKML